MKRRRQVGVLTGLLLSGVCTAERLRTELHVSATVVAACTTSTDLQAPRPPGSLAGGTAEASGKAAQGYAPWVAVQCGTDVPHTVTLTPATSLSAVGSAQAPSLLTVAVDF